MEPRYSTAKLFIGDSSPQTPIDLGTLPRNESPIPMNVFTQMTNFRAQASLQKPPKTPFTSPRKTGDVLREFAYTLRDSRRSFFVIRDLKESSLYRHMYSIGRSWMDAHLDVQKIDYDVYDEMEPGCDKDKDLSIIRVVAKYLQRLVHSVPGLSLCGDEAVEIAKDLLLRVAQCVQGNGYLIKLYDIELYSHRLTIGICIIGYATFAVVDNKTHQSCAIIVRLTTEDILMVDDSVAEQVNDDDMGSSIYQDLDWLMQNSE